MILARHAEALFWVGRHLERAECTSRWLDVAGRSAFHLLPEEAAVEWHQMLRALSLEARFEESSHRLRRQNVATFVLLSTDNPGSVRSSATAVRENLRVARDRVPVELWEEVNRLHLRLAEFEPDLVLDSEPNEVYATVREGCQAISGVIAESMARDEGHAFLVVGRMIERSILTVGLLTTALSSPRRVFDGDRVLRSSSALQAYRRLNGHSADPISTASFLLQAPDMPRSVLSCLVRAENRLLPLGATSAALGVPLQLIGRLRSRLEYGEVNDELSVAPLDVLADLRGQLLALADAVTEQVFRPLGDLILHAEYVRPGREQA